MRENRTYAWMFVITLGALSGCTHTPLAAPPPPPGVGAKARTEVPVHLKGSDTLYASTTHADKQSRLVFTLDDLHTDFTVHFSLNSPCVGVNDPNRQNDFSSVGNSGKASCDVTDTASGRYDYSISVPDLVPAKAKSFAPKIGYDVKNCVGCYVTVQ